MPSLDKKKKQNLSTFIFFVFLLLGMCGVVRTCNRLIGVKDDHIVEELIEDVIEGYYNLPQDAIDLTPDGLSQE